MVPAASRRQFLDDIQFAAAYGQPILVDTEPLMRKIQLADGPLDVIPHMLNGAKVALPPALAKGLNQLPANVRPQRAHIRLCMNNRNMNDDTSCGRFQFHAWNN